MTRVGKSGMFKQLFCISLLGASCFAQPLTVPAADITPKTYICYRGGQPMTIDGSLNEAAWARAAWTDSFVDIEGSRKPAPRFRTRAKMLWDDDYFYIAVEIQEPDIWATVKQRDDVIFQDNDFEIFIDPDGDTRDYCEFEMNALNTVWDLLLEMPYRDINKAPKDGWDFHGLKSGVTIHGTLNVPGDTDTSWIVEVAFPWKSFKEITEMATPPVDKDQWRVNFSRVEWKTDTVKGEYRKVLNPATQRPYPEDNWVWSPQGVVDMHVPEMWGFVQFSTKTVGEVNAAFVENPEECAKRFLRQMYYQENAFYKKSGTYTCDLSTLDLTTVPVPGYVLPPTVECTSNLFEASLRSSDGQWTIHIRNDGLTWRSRTKR